ncbi:MAG: SDR family oxidoreductase [Deltaproteobacteria bacterium]|nr:SDR family oxidoreductase [Deltaproteobacteria bacterium]
MAVVLITGSSSGIGKYTALEMARRGHRVFASMRNLESARLLRADTQKAQLAIEILQLDVTDPASVVGAVQRVLQRAGAIDVLVNNAGRGSIGVVEDYTDEEIHSVLETNFFGAVRTTRAVLPAMRARRSGTIIMMSSVSGLRTFPFASVYSASKFALEAISNGLRCELRPFGIRVVLIEPGNFRTRGGINMHFPKRIMPGSGEATSDPLYATLARRPLNPLPTFPLGDAHEIARLAAEVAESDDPRARYLIGEDAQHLMELDSEEFEELVRQRMKA